MLNKKLVLTLLFTVFSAIFSISDIAFAGTAASEYLCSLGVAYYRMGRYDDALTEFNKTLLLDPANKTARDYINTIIAKNNPPAPLTEEKNPLSLSKENAVNEAFNKLIEKEISFDKEAEFAKKLPVAKQDVPLTPNEPIIKTPVKKPVLESRPMARKESASEKKSFQEKVEKKAIPADEGGVGKLKIKGKVEASVGFTPTDVIWKRANYDLNEENYRSLSLEAYNRRANTFDTRIYDRLRLSLDTDNKEGFGFHSNITVDPWSFIGKGPKITINNTASPTGDAAEIEYKYWSNTGYTVNEAVYTLRNGASIALPEIQVVNGEIPETVVTNTWAERFVIPPTKIEREFWPLRELWVDYKQEGMNMKFFPLAYENQALTSDDPLKLSNNRSWWQESPWLYRWRPGTYNSGGSPDFTKGEWDDSLSYVVRDSDNNRLTELRGFSFVYEPEEMSSFATTFASPKGLWQDYDSFDNFASATRFKHLLTDNFSIGSIYTYRIGLNEGKNNKKDIVNHVMGLDFGYEMADGLMASAEGAQSFNKQDLTSPGYANKSRGNAYYFSLVGSIPSQDIMDLDYGYNELKPEKGEEFFTKARFFWGHMDKGFNPSLSNYRETRDDAFWSRHIHFKKPFEYYFVGLTTPSLTWEDVEPYRIGNGIDIGRDAIGFRLENSLWDKRLEHLFDLRNVHRTNGKYLETISRDEVTYKATDKATIKMLGLRQDMPRTRSGIDPFLIDSDTGEYIANSKIPDGANPSLTTGSIGLEYAFFDWLALNGIWEHTNDYTVGYDNFPRGNLNSTTFSTFRDYGKVYRTEDLYLYSQDLFPLPPYEFYNIFKTGLRVNPMENLEIYLDYTRNEFKSAGQIDDNINHIGLEVSYLPTKKIGLAFKYTYSKWNDLTLMQQGYSGYYLGHHNVFTEFRYMPSLDSEFVMQYGESGTTALATAFVDPFGSSLPTLNTQHIFRLFYRKKF